MDPIAQKVDVVVSFDTTGSMYPCLTQVRRQVEDMVDRLFGHIPNLRIGIIAHGDYCDANSSYVTKVLDLTIKRSDVCSFVRNVGSTYGGDAPECYELVLWQARSLTWRSDAIKFMVMIGDATPHPPEYDLNTKNLDWKNEAKMLHEQLGVSVYPVHAMYSYNSHSARTFWKPLAEMTGSSYITLDQFREIVDTLLAITYHQAGGEDFMTQFVQEVQDKKRMTRAMSVTFESLTGKRPEITAASPTPPSTRRAHGSSRRSGSTSSYRASFKTTCTEADLKAYGEVSLDPVLPGTFQVLEVDTPCAIKTFVTSELGDGAFVKGAGHYEFRKKPVDVQDYKKVVLLDRETGEMWSGDAARKMIGLPKGKKYRLKPAEVDLTKYQVFIQSTSINRKLLAGDFFLYQTKESLEAA